MPVTPRQCANAIRALSMDAVQKANSGHPGAPMGMADIGYALWTGHLKHSPKNPNWWNRDRFVLSNGHGSMLLYALLHLTGYDLSIEDLKQFRQLHSKTPGHPEHGLTAGVETTTGPLGQGLSNAVGMAIAEKVLAETYNRPELNIVDHTTYVFAGDGCLMEGISHEVCSFAGTLGLGKLIVLWDDNKISIDGPVEGWFADDTAKRFESYGWQVLAVDGHDINAVSAAIVAAKANAVQPTLIACRTTIGYGAPNLGGTAKTHGAPLGAAEVQAAREMLGWSYPPFEIPAEIYDAWNMTAKGQEQEADWQKKLDVYQQAYPDLFKTLSRRMNQAFPEDWAHRVHELATQWHSHPKSVATRKASQDVLEAISPLFPEFLGGSADLTESNLTAWSGSVPILHGAFSGNYLHYGVREFGMNGIMNGIALHGGFIPYGGTFLTFYDYGKNAVRMSALMKQRVIYVYSHDSIGLGEDGPTHQPIEQLSNLRTVPGLETWRPADALETLVSWQQALLRTHGPTALCLSRQVLPPIERAAAQIDLIACGAYVVFDGVAPELVLIATGSEVGLALSVAKMLATLDISARVVSMPSMERFSEQPMAYQESILPKAMLRRVAIEAAHSQSWHRWVGLEGLIISLDRFGESAPAPQLFDYFGFEKDAIISKICAQYSLGNQHN